MDEHAVVIAGGGPAGMMLAAELALAGVDVAIVEKRPDHGLAGSRAGGLLTRTIEVLDQRGVADRFLAEAKVHQAMPFGTAMLDMSDLPTRHPYFIGIFQNAIERIMGAWIAELPVRILFGHEVTGFAQDDDGVDVRLAGGEPLRAAVPRRVRRRAQPGPQGGRHRVPGVGRVEEQPDRRGRDDRGPAGGRPSRRQRHPRHQQEGDGETTIRLVVTERQIGPSSEPTLRDLSEVLVTVYGTDFGAHSPTWISRFTDTTRQAADYRVGRVLLAGDAAHVHYPAGGQGLSLGVQDAVNLGWKLAQVVGGTSPESLLDTYQDERHPVVARVLRHTMALGALQRQDDRKKALVEEVSELASMDEPRKRLVGIRTGLDIRYDLGEGHPLLGRRMPDLDLVTADGPLRVFELLHGARPALLNLGEPGDLDIAPWADRVQLVDATLRGGVGAPRPRRGRRSQGRAGPPGRPRRLGGRRHATGLPEALSTWFGAPAAT